MRKRDTILIKPGSTIIDHHHNDIKDKSTSAPADRSSSLRRTAISFKPMTGGHQADSDPNNPLLRSHGSSPDTTSHRKAFIIEGSSHNLEKANHIGTVGDSRPAPFESSFDFSELKWPDGFVPPQYSRPTSASSALSGSTTNSRKKKKTGQNSTTLSSTDHSSDLIESRLGGMPGSLALDSVSANKYFGVNARTRFYERYQWLNNQRNITSVIIDREKDNGEVTKLYFENEKDSVFHSRYYDDCVEHIPFGAKRSKESDLCKLRDRAQMFRSIKEAEMESIRRKEAEREKIRLQEFLLFKKRMIYGTDADPDNDEDEEGEEQEEEEEGNIGSGNDADGNDNHQQIGDRRETASSALRGDGVGGKERRDRLDTVQENEVDRPAGPGTGSNTAGRANKEQQLLQQRSKPRMVGGSDSASTSNNKNPSSSPSFPGITAIATSTDASNAVAGGAGGAGGKRMPRASSLSAFRSSDMPNRARPSSASAAATDAGSGCGRIRSTLVLGTPRKTSISTAKPTTIVTKSMPIVAGKVQRPMSASASQANTPQAMHSRPPTHLKGGANAVLAAVKIKNPLGRDGKANGAMERGATPASRRASQAKQPHHHRQQQQQHHPSSTSFSGVSNGGKSGQQQQQQQQQQQLPRHDTYSKVVPGGGTTAAADPGNALSPPTFLTSSELNNNGANLNRPPKTLAELGDFVPQYVMDAKNNNIINNNNNYQGIGIAADGENASMGNTAMDTLDSNSVTTLDMALKMSGMDQTNLGNTVPNNRTVAAQRFAKRMAARETARLDAARALQNTTTTTVAAAEEGGGSAPFSHNSPSAAAAATRSPTGRSIEWGANRNHVGGNILSKVASGKSVGMEERSATTVLATTTAAAAMTAAEGKPKNSIGRRPPLVPPVSLRDRTKPYQHPMNHNNWPTFQPNSSSPNSPETGGAVENLGNLGEEWYTSAVPDRVLLDEIRSIEGIDFQNEEDEMSAALREESKIAAFMMDERLDERSENASYSLTVDTPTGRPRDRLLSHGIESPGEGNSPHRSPKNGNQSPSPQRVLAHIGADGTRKNKAIDQTSEFFLLRKERRSSEVSKMQPSTREILQRLKLKGIASGGGPEIDFSRGKIDSPRTKYLAGCMREGVNPRASVVLRRNLSKQLNLQHHGIGDKMGKLLAESIPGLPYIQSINIADNKLTDEGMVPIISAAIANPGPLLEINLSQNEIGPVSAKALFDYLITEDCSLERLILNNADVDDFECERFINAVKRNSSLIELDLSNNKIGSAENLNLVMPDLITGGEAIAELLTLHTCKLKKLRLDWNMIRMEGALALARSIAVNQTLVYLDLSYNSLGTEGGLVLGASLPFNTALETLILTDNSLDSVATFTICAGIIENRGLQRVVLDGNPIGVNGLRGLMMIPLIVGNRVHISLARCNITIRDIKFWFDFENIPRDYVLNMELPYERAIALYLLQIVAGHQTFMFSKFTQENASSTLPAIQSRIQRRRSLLASISATATATTGVGGGAVITGGTITSSSASYSAVASAAATAAATAAVGNAGGGKTTPSSRGGKTAAAGSKGGKGNGNGSASTKNDPNASKKRRKVASKARSVELIQMSSTERTTYFGPKQRQVLENLKAARIVSSDIQAAMALFQEVDVDCSGVLDKEELGTLMTRLGMHMSKKRVAEMFDKFDVDQGGTIDVSEFIQLLKSQHVEATSRIHEMSETPVMALKARPEEEYFPPHAPGNGVTTILRISVTDAFAKKSVYRIMSSIDRENITEMAKQAGGSGAGGGVGGGTMSSIINSSLQAARLRLDEANAFFRSLLEENNDRVAAVKVLITSMIDFQDARALVHSALGNDQSELLRLRKDMGACLRPILGTPNGYYTLDMSKEMDRLCIKKLMEVSGTLASERAAASIIAPGRTGDLSQKGNRHSFRNEIFEGKPITITTNFVANGVPTRGKLDFDFCGAERPSKEAGVLSDLRLLKTLFHHFLIPAELCPLALYKLMVCQKIGESMLGCNGKNYYEATLERAQAIGTHMDAFYDNLPLRRALFEEAKEKESSTIVSTATFAHPAAGGARSELKKLATVPSIAEGKAAPASSSASVSSAVRPNMLSIATKNDSSDGSALLAEEASSVQDKQQDSSPRSSRETSRRLSFATPNSLLRASFSFAGNNNNNSGKYSPAAAATLRRMTSIRAKPNATAEVELFEMDTHPIKFDLNEFLLRMQQHYVTMSMDEIENAQNASAVPNYNNNLRNAALAKTVALPAFDAISYVDSEDSFTLSTDSAEGMPEHSQSLSLLPDNGLLQQHSVDGSYDGTLHKPSVANHHGGFKIPFASTEDDRQEGNESPSVQNLNSATSETHHHVVPAVSSSLFSSPQHRITSSRDLGQKQGPGQAHERSYRKIYRTKSDILQTSFSVELDPADMDEEEINSRSAHNSSQEGMAQAANWVEEQRIKEDMKTRTRERKSSKVQLLPDKKRRENIAYTDHKLNIAPSTDPYRSKLENILKSEHITIGAKANKIVTLIEDMFARSWIYARHLALMVECFVNIGYIKQTKYFGTYRVDLVVALFGRVVDVHNFEFVLEVLSPYEVACLYCRIGMLNLFNPCKPEGSWELDLSRREERCVAKMLCTLATHEPGDNWTRRVFRWSKSMDPMPGWELTQMWLTEEGMPIRGNLAITYYSGEGKRKKGCRPYISFRKSLLNLVLISEEEVVLEDFRTKPRTVIALPGESAVVRHINIWNSYLAPEHIDSKRRR